MPQQEFLQYMNQSSREEISNLLGVFLKEEENVPLRGLEKFVDTYRKVFGSDGAAEEPDLSSVELYLRFFFNACLGKGLTDDDKKESLSRQSEDSSPDSSMESRFDRFLDISGLDFMPEEFDAFLEKSRKRNDSGVKLDDIMQFITKCVWRPSLCDEKIVMDNGFVHVNHDLPNDPFNSAALVTMYLYYKSDAEKEEWKRKKEAFCAKQEEQKGEQGFREEWFGDDRTTPGRLKFLFYVRDFDDGPYEL